MSGSEGRQWEPLDHDCDDGAGPPTKADEDWYWHHVVMAQDRPVARNHQPEPLDGEVTLWEDDFDELRRQGWQGEHFTGQD